MNGSTGFFDEAARVGEQILIVLGGSPATTEVKTYLQLVARIFEILVDIHDGVAEVAIDVSQSANMDEAIQTMRGIEEMRLKDALRVEDLCDELSRLGQDLHPLIQATGLPPNDELVWDELCHKLEQAESGTARLYVEKLYDLRMLPHTEPSVESLKAKVEDISTRLVTLKARFDLLAKKARAMERRL